MQPIFLVLYLQMFKTMEAYDMGCGPGGGMSVSAMFKVCCYFFKS